MKILIQNQVQEQLAYVQEQSPPFFPEPPPPYEPLDQKQPAQQPPDLHQPTQQPLIEQPTQLPTETLPPQHPPTEEPLTSQEHIVTSTVQNSVNLLHQPSVNITPIELPAHLVQPLKTKKEISQVNAKLIQNCRILEDLLHNFRTFSYQMTKKGNFWQNWQLHK